MIGVVPAAGCATRWRGQLTHSKELYPLNGPSPHDGTVIGRLLEAFRAAGLEHALVVTRSSKLDIPASLLDGRSFGCRLAYVVLESSPSVPHSVAAAISFLHGHDVLLGFPDVVFEPHDAPRTLLRAWLGSDSDVLLGLFETDRPETADMVDIDNRGRVRRVHVKPLACALRYAWLLAVWSPRFTEYLRSSLPSPAGAEGEAAELHLGMLIQGAIDSGLAVTGLPIAGGRFLDLGSPEGARRLGRFLTSR